ncbi:hypothetical protein C8R45DRAFT_1095947 [Mycena sanguinolenta]|nr:hypothetical protein C8R45DRAFT_1095947 [Mycena sanguinolenta]
MVFNKSFSFLLSLLVFLQTTSAAAVLGRAGQTIRWLDCHDRVPAQIAQQLNVTGPTFPGALPANLYCGEMDVPMDYTQPFNAITNNITVGFAMTRPVQPAEGLILYHAGGPGQNAAVDIWASALNLSVSFSGLENFDVLGVNVRGLEFSNPLNLTTGVFFNNVSFPFPSTQDEFDQYTAAMENFYDAAVKDTTPPGIMQHLSTADVIQDWDTIRAALGYEKVNMAAVSYGTFAGILYAAKYPEQVNRFVLDAVIPHGGPLQNLVTSQRAAANRLVQRADAFCQNDPTCPFFGQGNGSVIQAWQTVLARSIQAPLPALSCGPGTGCNAPVTPSDLRQAAALIFTGNPDFTVFSKALHAALQGDASIMAYRPEIDVRESSVGPLLCSDIALDDDLKTFAGFNNMSVSSDSSDPLNIIWTMNWQLLLQCTVWPFTVDPSIGRVTLPNDLPIMWVTSDFDLNLPTELTTFAFQQTPNATLVIRHGDDHTSLPLAAPASTAGDLARDFLRTGIMPNPSSNVNVTVIGPGGARGPIPGAYDVPTGAVAGDMDDPEPWQQ